MLGIKDISITLTANHSVIGELLDRHSRLYDLYFVCCFCDHLTGYQHFLSPIALPKHDSNH